MGLRGRQGALFAGPRGRSFDAGYQVRPIESRYNGLGNPIRPSRAILRHLDSENADKRRSNRPGWTGAGREPHPSNGC